MKKAKIGAAVLSLLMLFGCQKPSVSSGTSSEEASSLPDSTETSSSAVSSASSSSIAASSSFSSSVETFYGITAFHNMTDAKVTLFKIKVGDRYQEGTSLSAVLTFDSFPSGAKAFVNDTAVTLYQNTEKPNEYSFTFTMPKEDVVLTLFIPFTPSEDGSVYTVVLEDTHASVWGIVSGKKYNCPSFKVFHEDGYLVHVSAYLTDTPFPVSISFSPENNAYTVDAHDASNQLLSDPITVYISTENVGVKILTYAGTENLKEGAVLPSSATPGDAVEVKSEVKDGLFFDKVTFSVSSLKEQSTPSFRFVMPNADLTVTFNLKDYGDVVIPATEHLSGYQLYSDSALTQEAKGYHPGADLYVKFTAEEKYQVYALSEDSGKNTVTSVTNNVFKVTVASDFWATLTLTPSLALAYSVTFKTGNHVSFALLDAADSSVCPGKTVKFTAVADHGYRVTSVTEADGKVQISGEGRANTYQFTSIPEDVEITASATDAAQADISFSTDWNKGADTFEFDYTTGSTTGTWNSLTLSNGDHQTISCKMDDVMHCKINTEDKIDSDSNYYILTVSASGGNSIRPSKASGWSSWDVNITEAVTTITIQLIKAG